MADRQMNNPRPARPKARTGGWGRILLATAAIIGLGWAGIGLDPASLNLDGWRWIVEADSPTPRLVRVFAHDGEVGAIAWSPDGSKIAAGGPLHSAVMIWEARTGALLRNLNREFGGVSAVAWSRDGSTVAAGRKFTEAARGHVAVHIWNSETGRVLQSLLGPSPLGRGDNDVFTGALSFSPDGKLIAAGHRGSVSIHDVTSGRLATVCRGHIATGKAVAFSPDGHQIATSGEYERSPVQLFDVRSGAQVRSMSGEPESPFGVAFRPDGKEIATVAFGRPNVTVWNVREGRPARALTGHSRPVYSVSYSPAGRLMASAAHAGGVIVWDSETGSRLLTLPNPEELTDVIAFSPDGRYLAVPLGRQVRVWDLSAVRRSTQK
jgi:WD40 repeat protein